MLIGCCLRKWYTWLLPNTVGLAESQSWGQVVLNEAACGWGGVKMIHALEVVVDVPNECPWVSRCKKETLLPTWFPPPPPFSFATTEI